PLWQAIRASVSLPAILPPVAAGGRLLVDGGILNNLPVDVMRERMQGPIIAVDLAADGIHSPELARVPGSIEYLRRRMFRSDARAHAPTLARIIMRVTTVASRKEAQRARGMADLYLAPPLHQYDLLDWRKMRQIAETGYRHALPLVGNWLAANPQYQDRASFLRHWGRLRAT
ncbi:MAG: patatin-like phospholipase family protein, partial [Sulfuritalea sp.]|nr:patatin-like phospholipase family protein [Sulfuritalea sp.]